MNEIVFDGTLAGWRHAVRSALARGCDPVITFWIQAATPQAELGRGEFTAPVPVTTDLVALHEAASTCRACPLWRQASCVIFGEGPPRARVVIVGEQPGDQEDRQGQPFVGPAGKLLDRALAEAGVDRAALYVTNAVKHFSGGRAANVACTPNPTRARSPRALHGSRAELRALSPEPIVCLGTTAAESVTGRPVKVLTERGRTTPTEFGAPAVITVHPSSLLRLPPGEDHGAAFARFVDDLRGIAARGR